MAYQNVQCVMNFDNIWQMSICSSHNFQFQHTHCAQISDLKTTNIFGRRALILFDYIPFWFKTIMQGIEDDMDMHLTLLIPYLRK